MKTKRIGRIAFSAVGLLLGFLALFLAPAAAAEGVRRGLMMCGTLVIPALFPMMVLCEFLSRSGWAARLGRWASPITRRLFGLPGPVGSAVLMGFIGGYPVGARAAVALYREGQIDRVQARRLICFCVNGGPAFLLSAVGLGLLNDRSAGILLLGCHWAASLLMGLVLGRFWSGDSERPSKPAAKESSLSLSETFVESTASASAGILSICAFVVLFCGGVGLLGAVSLPQGTMPWVAALLETTLGCRELIFAGVSLPALAAVLGFGGLCVHAQIFSAAKELELSPLGFEACRVSHAALSFLLCQGAVRLIPTVSPTISNGIRPMGGGLAASVPASVTMLCSAAVMLLCVSQKESKERKVL